MHFRNTAKHLSRCPGERQVVAASGCGKQASALPKEPCCPALQVQVQERETMALAPENFTPNKHLSCNTLRTLDQGQQLTYQMEARMHTNLKESMVCFAHNCRCSPEQAD